jgi:hypothetical protein
MVLLENRDYLGTHDLAIMLFMIKLPVILTELFLVYKEICLNWNRHANIFIYLNFQFQTSRSTYILLRRKWRGIFVEAGAQRI